MNSGNTNLLFALGYLWLSMGVTLFIFAAAIAVNLIKKGVILPVITLCLLGFFLGVIKSLFLKKMAEKKVLSLTSEQPRFLAIIQPKLILTMMSLGLFMRYMGFDRLRMVALFMVSIALIRSSFVYFHTLKANEKSASK